MKNHWLGDILMLIVHWLVGWIGRGETFQAEGRARRKVPMFKEQQGSAGSKGAFV